MVKTFFWRSSCHVGIDIQSTAIRMLMLQKSREGVCLKHAFMIELSKGVISDGKIVQLDDVVSAIKQLSKMAGMHQGAAVHSAFPLKRAMSKKIQRSKVFEIDAPMDTPEQYFPGIDDALAYDYVVCPHHAGEVMLVAVRQEELVSYVNAITQAGLSVQTVDLDLYALVRSVGFIAGHMLKAKTCLIIEVTQSGCSIVKMVSGEIVFQQAVPDEKINETSTFVQFVRRLIREEASISDTTAYILGDALRASALADGLVGELQIEVQVLSLEKILRPTEKHVSETMDAYGIACGLALKGLSDC